VEPSALRIQEVLQKLQSHAVDAVVVGGIAAVASGVPYVTHDIDICYDPAPENIQRLIDALKEINARLRVARMSDDEARQLPFMLDLRTFRDNEMLTLETDLGSLDLLRFIPGIGDFPAVKAAAIEAEIFGARFLALDLPALVTNKRATARSKDLLALPLIEATLRARQLAQD